MTKHVNFILSLIILFPFIAWIVRHKTISKTYNPFIILITLAAFTELINYLSIILYRTNVLIINIYSFFECSLIISQFYYWRYYSHTKRWYPYFAALCSVIWVTDNLVIGHVTKDVGVIFRISAAFVLVILSINEINYLIINYNKNLLKNSRFLICTGFLIYFLYEILLEGSIYISNQGGNSTASKIIQLSTYVNVLVNIIYGAAIIFIPKKSSLHFEKMDKG
jgi:hypothetical protein